MKYQRDAFISTINELALNNKNIVFLSADFGAPALDKLRETIPLQFFHLGISEQNLIDVAIGLSLKGKVVITYAMAPFISLRCAEQHKIAAMMNLPIINLIAGVGLGYANAGPTHYATEDYSIAMNIIGSSVITTADSSTASACAFDVIENPKFCFIRLDRSPGEDLSTVTSSIYQNGYRKFYNGKKIAIISHGYMSLQLHRLLKDYSEISENVTLFDVFRSKPAPSNLFLDLDGFENVITVDEQIQSSSLGLYLLPNLIRSHNSSQIHQFFLKELFMFGNDGRDSLISEAGLIKEEILEKIINLLK